MTGIFTLNELLVSPGEVLTPYYRFGSAPPGNETMVTYYYADPGGQVLAHTGWGAINGGVANAGGAWVVPAGVDAYWWTTDCWSISCADVTYAGVIYAINPVSVSAGVPTFSAIVDVPGPELGMGLPALLLVLALAVICVKLKLAAPIARIAPTARAVFPA